MQEAVYESDFDDDDAGGDPGGTAAHAAAAAAERAAAAALSPAVLPAPAGGDDDVTAYDLFGSEDEGDPRRRWQTRAPVEKLRTAGRKGGEGRMRGLAWLDA